MSTPKEPNFFSDDAQFSKGIDWYKSLFSGANPVSLLGEASTHYSKLPTYPETIRRLKETVPGAKFVYVMRHPIDRLISHYIHEWTMGVYSCELNQALELYPEMTNYSQYAMQLKPYFEIFGRQSVCPVFFDRLVNHPQSELERVCRFIGYTGKPRWVTDLIPSNVSSNRIKRFPLYDQLVENRLATWFRRSLVPKRLRDRIKNRLTMNERPRLSEGNENRLVGLFDRDLETLGNWLGIDLNCANFKEQTKSASPEWITPNE
jgi:hypothetical protein